MDNAPIKFGSSFQSTTVAISGTAQTIVSASSNLNGMIVWDAEFSSANATAISNATILAKATPPTTVIDGDVVVSGAYQGAGSNFVSVGKLRRPVFIPAGKGLYFIAGTNETGAMKRVLYTLL